MQAPATVRETIVTHPEPPSHGRAVASRRSRLRALGVAALVLVAALYGVVRYAPFYLPDLPPGVVVDTEGPQTVFGYATLTYPLVRFVVVGRFTGEEPARLAGFRRTGRDITPDTDAVLDGEAFEVSERGLRRLDRYEQRGERYERVRMTLTDGREVWVYRMID